MLFLYMPGAATRDVGAPVGRTQLTESDALQSSLWRLAQRTGVWRFTVSVTIAGAAHELWCFAVIEALGSGRKPGSA